MRDLKIFLTNSKGKALAGENQGSAQELLDEDEFNVPDEVETVLEELFKALRDRDTIVRYSAAKGVARVSERLPVDFTEQVLEQVLQLFSIHSIAVASIYDMPSIAEGTWHGACLACAEMARRGLIPDERLAELVGWLYKVRIHRLYSVDDVDTLQKGTLLRYQEGSTLDWFKRARRSFVCALVSRPGTERRCSAAACAGACKEACGRVAL